MGGRVLRAHVDDDPFAALEVPGLVGGGDDGVVFEAKEGVLVKGEAALDGALAEGDVVHLGAGEVLQRGAVAGARKQAHIHLQVAAQREADLVLAFGEQLVDERKRGDVVYSCLNYFWLTSRAGDKQVEVAAGLAPPFRKIGDLDPKARLDQPQRRGVIEGVAADEPSARERRDHEHRDAEAESNRTRHAASFLRKRVNREVFTVSACRRSHRGDVIEEAIVLVIRDEQHCLRPDLGVRGESL